MNCAFRNAASRCRSILVVDDEPEILHAIEDLLEDTFVVHTAASGPEALSLLARQAVAVIVSDQRMPGMDGDEFLRRAREYSSATRILLTGYSDVDALVRAVNLGQIHAYVAKPWNPAEFQLVVNSAYEHFSLRNAVAESEALLRSVMDSVSDAILVLDAAGTVALANEAAERMLRHPLGDIVGSAIGPLLALGRTGQTGHHSLEPGRREMIAVRRDGSQLPIELMIDTLVREGRRFFIAVLRDIAERQRAREERARLEQALAASERMQAVGMLASGITHEFNNILQPILTITALTAESLPEGSRARANLGHVVAAVERAAEIVAQVRSVSRDADMAVGPVRVDKIARDAAHLLRLSAPACITVDAENMVEATVTGSAGAIHQILMNLATNALHAMALTGGTLKISVGIAENTAIGSNPLGLPAGRSAVLEVRDTGPGIDKETLLRMFEPFFTTRKSGKGMGLGLSVVRDLVDKLGGVIIADSAPGEGCRMTVYLPAA